MNLSTWFEIVEFKPYIQDHDFKENQYYQKNEDLTEVKYKSKIVWLKLNKEQKLIIDVWLNSYIKMYNIAINYIKENIDEKQKFPKVLNFEFLRSRLLEEKKEIIEASLDMKVHDIDYAIKLACQNYKSARSNFKAGHIKHFRIRNWKLKKSIKIMDMEKNNFRKNTIRKNVLGIVKGYYNGEEFDFNTINCDCRLRREEGKYYLYVSELVTKVETEDKSKQITIDPGLRRFGTGITEDKIVKIGDQCQRRIIKYYKRNDKIQNNVNINNTKKSKNEKRTNRKIKNLVNELHWKTINYLVKNYETVLIGDMSSKDIVGKKGNLNKMSKRVASSLSFYKFHLRLKYKCKVNEVKYYKINEWMTSKMCSLCGTINENLGSDEIFHCSSCLNVIERDINGARGIHIKGIL
jgi:putative transposase